MTTLPLPVDAATTADDAADYLVQMHREGCINLHAHAPLSPSCITVLTTVM